MAGVDMSPLVKEDKAMRAEVNNERPTRISDTGKDVMTGLSFDHINYDNDIDESIKPLHRTPPESQTKRLKKYFKPNLSRIS